MRIVATKVYRAFPELDRFTDGQCERFVAAACKRGWRRWLHRGLLLVAASAAFGATSAGVIAISVAVNDSRASDSAVAVGATLGIITILGVPGVATLLLKDLFLLRRIRYVLRTRGQCPSCLYSLLGIPLTPAGRVVCPECGFESEVDPSLSELAHNGSGQAVVTPAAFEARPVFWTAARRRGAKRLALFGAGALVLAGLIGGGGYEIFIRRQAAAARAMRISPADIEALAAQLQPQSALDAWNLFDSIAETQRSLELQTVLAIQPPAPLLRELVADYSFIAGEWSDPDDAERLAWERACRDAALECLEAYRAAGLFDRMREMRAIPRAVRPVALPASQPLLFAPMPELGLAGQLVQINTARMRLAAEAGDLDEFADAFESALAIGRMVRQQPLLFQGLVGQSLESAAFHEARRVISAGVDETWLDAIEGAIDRQRAALPPGYHFEGQRLATRDAVAWLFAQPGRARFGRFAPDNRSWFGASPLDGGRLGTLRENIAVIDEHTEAAKQLAATPLADRMANLAVRPADDLLLIDAFLPAFDHALASFEAGELSRTSVRVIIAIERFRLQHGEHPESLAQLVPSHLAEIPTDPWSGRPLLYSRLAPGRDPSGRGYLLYSTGADGIDDGGAEPPRASGRRWYRVPQAGEDMVLNPPR